MKRKAAVTRLARQKVAKPSQENITAAIADLEQLEPTTPQATAVIRLLISWLKDESGYDEEVWPALKEALDQERDRIGARRLFDG